MRADQYLMIGVGVLGIYALYRLTKADGGAVTRDNTLPVAPPAGPPTSPSQDVAKIDLSLPPAPAPTTLNLVTGNPLTLRGGAFYKGRLEMSPTTTASDVVAALTALGFERVEAFVSRADAEGVIEQPFALANPGRGTRWFRARIPAFGPTSIPRPAGLTVIWQAAPPADFVPMAGVAGVARAWMPVSRSFP